ncbi:MAG TPA: hypothetical protein DDW50_06630 [Firmicutes bacterium]|jgi:hypothetical protein|nr:hypothetical protein [Bacillota bacterium]
MSETAILRITDHFLKPKKWYEFTEPVLQDFKLIATKDDQKYAGLAHQPVRPKVNHHGPNPIQLYRDYYGTFHLRTKLVPEELPVKFAIGYTMHSKVITVDDYSNFGWLRLATGIEEYIYPNLCHYKQLLDYIMAHSKYPRFAITRVYFYLQNDIYEDLTAEILKRESL